MNVFNMASIIFVILNAHLINTKSNYLDTRELKDSENVGRYFTNFNQLDNAITTVLPLLDSDGTSNVVNDALDDDALVSQWIDDGNHYFRASPDNNVNAFPEPISKEKQEIFWYNEDAPDHLMDIRGKKFLSFYPLRFNPKRAPSGFLGLRGKKYNFDGVKRVPSGFTGMRGKKSLNGIDDNVLDNPGGLEHANGLSIYELLQKERIKLNELNEIYQMDQQIQSNPEFALAMALHNLEKQTSFTGMRDKKVNEDPNKYLGAKRAPSGFLGLRGKRENNGDYNRESKRDPFTSYLEVHRRVEPVVPEIYQQKTLSKPLEELRMQINRMSPKRAPNGFLGVRGKKWTVSDNGE